MFLLGLLELSSMPKFGGESDEKEPSNEKEVPGWLQGILLCTIVNITQVNKQAL